MVPSPVKVWMWILMRMRILTSVVIFYRSLHSVILRMHLQIQILNNNTEFVKPLHHQNFSQDFKHYLIHYKL